MMQINFYRYVLIVLIIPVITACKIDRKKTVDRDRFTFKMNDDDHLFFKNVRRAYYDFMDMPLAHQHVYRYADRYPGNDRPMIYPTIVIAWLKNEAYILIEINESLIEENSLIIREKHARNEKLYEYELKHRGRENMLEFATKIYEGIMAENEVYIKHNDQYRLLFTTETDREAFRIPMADYYRLTGVFGD